MNPRTALLASLIAVGLVLMTWLIVRAPSAPASPRPAHRSELARCVEAVSIAATGSDGSVVTLTLDSRTDLWLLDDSGVRWPVESASIQGCLRLLADLGKAPASDVSAPGENTAAALLISIPGSRDVRVIIAGGGVAGRTKLYEQTQTGWLSIDADARLAELFLPRNLAAWRRTDVLSGAGSVSEVAAEAAGKRLTLRHIDGRWALVHPVACPADQDNARQLAAGSVIIASRWLDTKASSDASDSFANPTAVLGRRFRLPPAGVYANTEEIVVELVCGQSADASQATFLARVEARFVARSGGQSEPAWGPITCVVDRGAIEGFAKSAESYASERSVQAPAMDVARVQVFAVEDAMRAGQPPMPPEKVREGESSFSRTLDGWTLTRGGTGDRACDDATARTLASVLGAVCDRPAEHVLFREPDESLRTLGALAVSGSRGLLEVLVVGESATPAPGAPGSAPNAIVRCGRVYREYTGEDAVALRTLLRDHLTPEG
jgi:hypothetical protein